MRLGLFVATGVYWPDTNGGPPPEDDWTIVEAIAIASLGTAALVGVVAWIAGAL